MKRRILTRESCVVTDAQCCNCICKAHCAYAWFFESHISKSNDICRGINRASHPFILSIDQTFADKPVRYLTVQCLLIGVGIAFMPNVIRAFDSIGVAGIGKDRHTFYVASVRSNGRELSEFKLKSEQICQFELNKLIGLIQTTELHIQTRTPIRMLRNNEILGTIDYLGFIKAVYHRLVLLEGFYGTEILSDFEETFHLMLPKRFLSNFEYQSHIRYSGRQKCTHDLGGFYGSMIIEGEFSEFERSLLKAGELFHVGKNTGFGLGRYTISSK